MAGIQIAEILAILSWGQVDLDEGSAESFRALLRGDILKTAVLMRTWYDDNMLIYHESLRFQLLRHTRYDAVSWSLDASRGYPLETQAGNSKHPTQMQMSFIPLKDGTTICHHHVWWSEGTVVYWINFSSPNADKYPQKWLAQPLFQWRQDFRQGSFKTPWCSVPVQTPAADGRNAKRATAVPLKVHKVC